MGLVWWCSDQSAGGLSNSFLFFFLCFLAKLAKKVLAFRSGFRCVGLGWADTSRLVLSICLSVDIVLEST